MAEDPACVLDNAEALFEAAEAEAECKEGDLLGVSLLLPPLNNASNSSSSKSFNASTSRCDGNDIVVLIGQSKLSLAKLKFAVKLNS